MRSFTVAVWDRAGGLLHMMICGEFISFAAYDVRYPVRLADPRLDRPEVDMLW